MTIPPPDPSPSDADLKMSWEIRKLQAEVEALRRPFKNPSVIAALTTAALVAVVSFAGLTLQWARSDREYALAQIRTEKLDLEAAQLQKQRSDLETEIAQRNADLKKVRDQLNELEKTLKGTTVLAAELQDTRARMRHVIEQLRIATTATPTVEISIKPDTIRWADWAILYWSSTGATHVDITPDIGRREPSGHINLPGNETTIYKIIATDAHGRTATSKAVLNVIR